MSYANLTWDEFEVKVGAFHAEITKFINKVPTWKQRLSTPRMVVLIDKAIDRARIFRDENRDRAERPGSELNLDVEGSLLMLEEDLEKLQSIRAGFEENTASSTSRSAGDAASQKDDAAAAGGRGEAQQQLQLQHHHHQPATTHGDAPIPQSTSQVPYYAAGYYATYNAGPQGFVDIAPRPPPVPPRTSANAASATTTTATGQEADSGTARARRSYCCSKVRAYF